MEPDFGGYATKANVKCADGRTIMAHAFKDQDGAKLPLVWQHGHSEHTNVLGHVYLENREDGVYCKGYFNDTVQGKNTKDLVQHGDLDSLSIWADGLIEKSKQVIHGAIAEVSLCLRGANSGAKIDFVQIEHASGDIVTASDEAVITMGLPIEHAAATAAAEPEAKVESKETDGGETGEDILATLNEKQRDLFDFIVGKALSEKPGDDSVTHSTEPGEGNLQHQKKDEDMVIKHNVFDSGTDNGTSTATGGSPASKHLSHDQISSIVTDEKKTGSLKESFLAHAGEYGVQNLEVLFPEAKVVDNIPELISRSQEWVNLFMSGTKKVPFTRIKTIWASITHEEARANGYLKGNFKKEEFFRMNSRKTEPGTIYKKQRLDRDDIIDITTMDVVAFLWGEMRIMFNEELARAGMLGDGRSYDDVDKVDPTKIRPIVTDSEFFVHRIGVAPVNKANSEDFVEAVVRSRKFYRGTGSPVMFTTEDTLTTLLLSKDDMGRRLYSNQSDLQAALRVSNIVPVELLEEYVLPEDDDDEGKKVAAVYLNLSDYSWGTDAGGELAKFDDFDIDYNQYKYLMEGRTSAALTKFKSAVVFVEGGTSMTERYPEMGPDNEPLAPERYEGTQRYVNGRGGVNEQGRTVNVSENPKAPTKVGNTVQFAAATGYKWKIDGGSTLVAPGTSVQQATGAHTYEAVPDSGFEFAPGTQRNFSLTFS